MMDRRTALIVEDDPTLQMAMVKRLARMGFEVASASHFEAADSHLTARALHIDIIHRRAPSEPVRAMSSASTVPGPLGLMDLPILIMCQDASPGDMAYAEDVGGDVFFANHSRCGSSQIASNFLNARRSSAPPIANCDLDAAVAGGLVATDLTNAPSSLPREGVVAPWTGGWRGRPVG